jgi:hypothetical protein
MNICVSDELKDIKSELINRGYSISNNLNNMPCDAIICNLKDGGLLNINSQNNIKREGTLIIDCGSKTVDEIEYILNNRLYSAIF